MDSRNRGLLQLPLAFPLCRLSSGRSLFRDHQLRLELVDEELVTRILLATTLPGDDDKLLTKEQLAELRVQFEAAVAELREAIRQWHAAHQQLALQLA